MEKWIYYQMMYVYGVESMFDYMRTLKMYNVRQVSKSITQDVLLLAGNEDHIIPIRMYKRQLNALKNASSIEGHIFTKEEHASNHYQVGNIGLALNYIIDWIKKKI